MSVLVTFSKDWADEFQVEGFKIFESQQAWKNELELLKYANWSFGSNEGFDPGEITENDFTLKNISEADIALLKRLFDFDTDFSWGNFPYYDSEINEDLQYIRNILELGS